MFKKFFMLAMLLGSALATVFVTPEVSQARRYLGHYGAYRVYPHYRYYAPQYHHSRYYAPYHGIRRYYRSYYGGYGYGSYRPYPRYGA